MKIILIILLLLTVAQAARAQNSVYQVGMKTRLFSDEKRTDWSGGAPRPLLTMIWYPAEKDVIEREITIGAPDKPLFLSGRAARDVKISSGKKHYPLIVLSHGTGGAALQMMWLGEFLARRGFIVAAANHHGNTGAEDKLTAQGSRLWWERSRDLSLTIDKMLADDEFGKLIDKDKIGIAGFSLGGTTVLSVAGGVFNPDALAKFCASSERDATCGATPENPTAEEDLKKIADTDAVVIASIKRAKDSYLDKRVKAVFAVAPALGYAFDRLDSIKIPVEIVVGAKDTSSPPVTNAVLFDRQLKNSKLTILPGEVSHYVFLSECGSAGIETLPQICLDAKTVNRAAVHREVGEMAFKFFQKNL